MNTIALTINLPTGSRNPQAYHDAIHQAIAAATARGDSIGAHALAGLLALMMPLSSGGGWAQGGPVNMDAWNKAGPPPLETLMPIEWAARLGFDNVTPHERCPRCYARPNNCHCADPSKPA